MKKLLFAALCVWQVAGYAAEPGASVDSSKGKGAVPEEVGKGAGQHAAVLEQLNRATEAGQAQVNALQQKYPAEIEWAKNNPVPAAVIAVSVVGFAYNVAKSVLRGGLIALSGYGVGLISEEVRKSAAMQSWRERLSEPMRNLVDGFYQGFILSGTTCLGWRAGGIIGGVGAFGGYTRVVTVSWSDLHNNVMQLGASGPNGENSKAHAAGVALGVAAGATLAVGLARVVKG